MPNAPANLIAAVSDRYRIEREIGQGGMATVYLAHDLKHDRDVALKVLRPDLAATLGPERFLREIQIAARLQHPNILPVHDSGEAAGFLYYVMPFVEGHSLRERLSEHGELPVGEAIRILRDVGEALAHAHSHGVLHRDIKPENVMLSGRHALVADFGVAKAVHEATGRQKLTTVGVALGTPTYMAPEQAAADPHADHRADIYAFGVTAYELLAGRPPFSGITAQAILAAHLTEAPAPVSGLRTSLPQPLAQLVMRCLEKKPADRPQSAEDLLQVLESLATPSGGITPVATNAGRFRSLLPKVAVRSAHVRAFSALALVVFAALAYGGFRVLANRGVGGDRSIAVLTFENIGADTGAAYLAEGLADGISTSLSGVARLKVVSRTAVRRLARESALTPANLGENLGATNLVGGSIQRAGGRLRVTVELIRARTGEQLWTARYDTTALDVLGVQGQIAEAVALSVAGRLLPAERTRVVRHATISSEAYDHYLRANRLMWDEAEQSLLQAIGHYEAALSLDSAFTAARGRLAWAYGVALNWAYRPGGLSPDEVMARGLAAADRALREDSVTADAWLGRGYLLFFRGAAEDYPVALGALQKAVMLDPSNDLAHLYYAIVLRRMGRFEESEQEYVRALALNPERHQTVADMGFIAASRRSYPIAVQWYSRAKARDTSVASSRTLLGRMLAATGDLAGALQEARAGVALSSASQRGRALATLAEIEARAGNASAARGHFRQAMQEIGVSQQVLPDEIGVRNVWQPALAAVALGERELALSFLERARPRGPWLWSYLIYEGFDPIRQDPRFRAIIDESRPPGAKDPF